MNPVGKKLNYVIFALLAIALALGTSLFLKSGFRPQTSPVNPAGTPTSSTSASGKYLPSSIFDLPAKDASPAEIKAYENFLHSVAVIGDTLDVTGDNGCSVKPQVLEVKLDSTVNLKNNDSSNHTIKTGSTKVLVPQSGTASFKANIDNHGIGNYAYTCDNSPKLIGILRIVN